MARGAVLTLEQTWTLAKRWYDDRLDPDWRRPTADEAARAFASVGLVGDFWFV
jgi:hypothetical protein